MPIMRPSTIAIFAALALLPVAAGAATPFDGVYKGGNELSLNRSSRCSPGFRFNLTVANGSFAWTLPDGASVTVQVAPDGGFTAQNGRRFLQGQIVGRFLTGHTTGEACEYNWSLAR